MDTYFRSVIARCGVAGSAMIATAIFILGILVVSFPAVLPWIFGVAMMGASLAFVFLLATRQAERS